MEMFVFKSVLRYSASIEYGWLRWGVRYGVGRVRLGPRVSAEAEISRAFGRCALHFALHQVCDCSCAISVSKQAVIRKCLRG